VIMPMLFAEIGLSWWVWWMDQMWRPMHISESSSIRLTQDILRKRLDKIETATLRHGVV